MTLTYRWDVYNHAYIINLIGDMVNEFSYAYNKEALNKKIAEIKEKHAIKEAIKLCQAETIIPSKVGEKICEEFDIGYKWIRLNEMYYKVNRHGIVVSECKTKTQMKRYGK